MVDGAPSTALLMLRAALPLVPGLGGRTAGRGGLHDLAVTRHDVRVDPARVASYAALCGFPRKDTLPVAYPHLLAFPLHLTLMTDRAFPYPALGTVHLENTFTQHRAIGCEEPLQITVRAGGPRPHAKGTVFDLETSVLVRGELVWEEVSTFLRRGAGDPRAPRATRLAAVPGTVEWRLAGDLGRRYASVSGDHNPIHLYALTARALGFPRQIAHGMWSLSRCLGAIENRLGDSVRVEAAFTRPVLLPGAVSFGTRLTHEGRLFSLTRPTDGAPHVVGRTT